MTEIWKLPMAEQIKAMQTGEIRVAKFVQVYLDRLEKFGGKNGLNVFSQINPHALEEAKALDAAEDKSGILFGLPILVKDNIDVAGMLTTAGSMTLQDNLAVQDAPIIENLRKAGAVILGKANMTEFANCIAEEMHDGYSSFGGQVIHAYDSAHDPSGSSTGSAVAVSAGLCAAAIGTDTSFSIVGCVMENGVTGLKPAHGSLPGNGIIPIAYLLDSAGPITRTVEDAWRVYAAMRGDGDIFLQTVKVNELRLLVNTVNDDDQSDIQRRMTQVLFDRLREAGAEMRDAEHPYQRKQLKLMRCAYAHDLEVYFAGTNAKNRTLARIIEAYKQNPVWMPYGIDILEESLGRRVDEAEYADALAERERVRSWLLQELEDYDACIMTGPTNIMHFCGLPSIAIRLGMGEDGVPRGLILYGADEKRLVAAARCMEQYTEPVVWPKGVE